jgi:hypothetical protein
LSTPVIDVESVIAGVDDAFATDPASPLAETTETVVTVPEPTELKLSDPEPSVVNACPFVPSVPGSVNVVLEEVLAD